MSKMKLGCYYHYIYLGAQEKHIALDQALDIAKENGIQAIFMSLNDLHDESPNTFRKRLEQHGMYVADVVADFPCGVNSEEYASSLEQMKHHLRVAKYLGSPSFMPVPLIADSYQAQMHRHFVSGIRRLLREITAYGHSLGIQVSVENFSLRSLPCSTIEDIQYLLDTIPHLGFVLDSGNFHFVGADEIAATKLFLPHITGVHLKDIKEVSQSDYSLGINGKHRDSMELGGGIIKNKEVVEYLGEHGYCGPLNIEINCGPCYFDRLLKSVAYLRKVAGDYIE